MLVDGMVSDLHEDKNTLAIGKTNEVTLCERGNALGVFRVRGAADLMMQFGCLDGSDRPGFVVFQMRAFGVIEDAATGTEYAENVLAEAEFSIFGNRHFFHCHLVIDFRDHGDPLLCLTDVAVVGLDHV
jgi:hypothetical protein